MSALGRKQKLGNSANVENACRPHQAAVKVKRDLGSKRTAVGTRELG